MLERRGAERTAAFQLPRVETGDVVPRSERDRARVRLERLHDDPAGGVAAAASGELGQQLERALLRAEVRQAEAGVGIDHRGELDAGEVMALCDHLGPAQNGALRAREPLERLLSLPAARVEPDHLQLRNLLRELAFELLRARTDARELRRAAHRTRV